MARVLNKKTDEIPPDAVYIGRGSKWGNPFRIGEHGSRADVIRKYRIHAKDTGLDKAAAKELAGKDLVCFCAPKPCHGDVLLEFANAKTR